MNDLILPDRPDLIAMVLHTRQLLLRDGSPEALALLNAGQDEANRDAADGDSDASAAPPQLDYTRPEVLEKLTSWLERHVRRDDALKDLLGRDPVFLHVLAQSREQAVAEKPLRKLSPIRIHGPTGSGKELLARAIHDTSGVGGEFVAVHCAGITDDLLESTLFGYVDGAFTGGVKGGREGLVQLAEGGTLFLDEVGDLPPRAQVTLLRFLQDQKYRKVGGTKEEQADVRLMCATLKDLEDLAARGAFRADLLYRLSGVRLSLPGLESRRHELLELAEQMIRRAGCRDARAMDAQVRLILGHTQWPGNLRQLDMELREAVRRAQGGLVMAMHLTPARLAEFYGQGRALRMASEIVGWSLDGQEPSDDLLVDRTRRALVALKTPAIPAEEHEGERSLVLQVRSAFGEQDRPHALLGGLLEAVGKLHQLDAERASIVELVEILPAHAAGPVHSRIEQIEAERLAVEEEHSRLGDDLAARLPGMFQVFQFIYGLPGIGERERLSLFKSLATIIQLGMQLLPTFAARGLRRLAANSIEQLVLDVDEEQDPNNPFLSDRKPEDRPQADWAWLAENTSSLREAADLSRHSRNTVKVYFERHGLTQARG